jgi:hypothetical protein
MSPAHLQESVSLSWSLSGNSMEVGVTGGKQCESDCKQVQVHLLRQEIRRTGMAREEAGRQREAKGHLVTWGFR